MTDRKGKKEGKFIASALFFLKPHDLDLQKAINRYYINSIQLWSTIFFLCKYHDTRMVHLLAVS